MHKTFPRNEILMPSKQLSPPYWFNAIFLFCLIGSAVHTAASEPLVSFETSHTIMKVRTAKHGGRMMIIGSSYEGAVLAMSDDGKPLWKNDLTSGIMNHDLWCEDITGDGNDEILAANADGHLYCLNTLGKLVWKFKMNDAPMYAVCVVHQGDKPLVVCGGFDNNIYYLSAQGKQVKVLPSKGYSIAKPWGNDPAHPKPPKNLHYANFLRKIVMADGSEQLVVHGCMNHMQDKGVLYLFDPLADKPTTTITVDCKRAIGDVHVTDDGKQILFGTSAHGNDASLVVFDTASEKMRRFTVRDLKKKVDSFGYRVLQAVEMPAGSSHKYLVLYGSHVLLIPEDLNVNDTEVLRAKYSYNDLWNDLENNRVIFASSQSGGSCIHVVDLKDPGWKEAYTKLTPPGNITSILNASKLVRRKTRSFKRPPWERDPRPVYMMSESVSESLEPLAEKINAESTSPVFLGHKHFGTAEDWDRSSLQSEKYQKKRDQRRKYTLTSDQAVQGLLPQYQGYPGAAFWAGHGNDPYMYTLDTLKKVIEGADGKKTVLIYPELEDHSKDFEYVMDHHFYPLAKFSKDHNTNIYVRTKNIFWLGGVYLPAWSRLVSGEFAEVFVPAMEETTDKSMELSIAGRSGMWASGAVDGWGSRCARDNPSFDRARQHAHQMLPNHFLRMMIYHVSSGAQYLDNFPVDQEYMSLLWELISSGALYVPQRDEIVSYSPVHLSMLPPDHDYLLEGSNVKWSTFFDEKTEADRPMVFSRLNGSWPGAPVTPWDFSRYAAGVKDRRLNFLPPYENGLVLVTPPQKGAGADQDAPRGKLSDHLHPIYKDLLSEYYTDGRYYYSADGKDKLPADKHYTEIESDIRQSAKKLPLTVSGDVAWVAAQTSPTHLRLTIIDGGYINPKNRKATVSFNTAQPAKMTDVLFGNEFDLSDPSSVDVTVPCGMFRFIDIELKQPLIPSP